MFASSDFTSVGVIFWFIIIFIGIGRTARILKGNPTVRSAAKKGVFNVLGRLFSK